VAFGLGGVDARGGCSADLGGTAAACFFAGAAAFRGEGSLAQGGCSETRALRGTACTPAGAPAARAGAARASLWARPAAGFSSSSSQAHANRVAGREAPAARPAMHAAPAAAEAGARSGGTDFSLAAPSPAQPKRFAASRGAAALPAAAGWAVLSLWGATGSAASSLRGAMTQCAAEEFEAAVSWSIEEAASWPMGSGAGAGSSAAFDIGGAGVGSAAVCTPASAATRGGSTALACASGSSSSLACRLRGESCSAHANGALVGAPKPGSASCGRLRLVLGRSLGGDALALER